LESLLIDLANEGVWDICATTLPLCPNLKEIQFTGVFTDSAGAKFRPSKLSGACSKFPGNVVTFKKTWFQSYQALKEIIGGFGGCHITTLHLDQSGMADGPLKAI
jgi:hypothetical protein